MPKAVIACLLCFALVFVASGCSSSHPTISDTRHANVLVKIINEPCAETDSKDQPSDTQAKVEEMISQYGEAVGVAVLPLDGVGFSINGDKSFVSASMIKLLIVSEYIERVKSNAADPNSSVTVSNIVGGAGVVQNKGTGNYKMSDLVSYMISNSDNTATNALIDVFGFDAINGRASAMGLSQTNLNRKMMTSGEENHISANDAATILKSIANHSIGNAGTCSQVEGYLKAQADTKGIKEGLPSDVEFGHKTGDLAGIRHDGGIVYSITPYVIVVLTELPNEANRIMSKIASVVHADYAARNASSTNSNASSIPTPASEPKKSGTSQNPRVSNATKEKDGYKIPGDYTRDNGYTGQNWSLDDSERGKGLFGSEDYDFPGQGADYSATHYAVNARWEYASYNVVKNKWKGHASHVNRPGSADGISNIKSNDGEQYAWTYKQHVLVRNPENGKSVVCTAGCPEASNPNYGGNPLDAVGGLSYKAQEALGFSAGGLKGSDYDVDCHSSGVELEMWWVPEDTPLGPCEVNAIQDNNENCDDDTTTSKVGSGVEGAVSWAERAAQSDTCGYSQGDRNSCQNFDGTTDVNTDCSALVFWSLVKGGGYTEFVDLCPTNAFTTDDNQETVLTQMGWVKHALNSVDELQRGDILWRSGHTGWYIGDGGTCEAHSSRGNAAPGDQAQRNGATGHSEEVGTGPEGANPKGFTHYFRLES